MARHRFHLVNVFADAPLSGNALCVFENGAMLTTADMQALALQFNLSETTFVLPSSVATAALRIFTPTFEMPFAGHPVLGSAHVIRSLFGAGDAITLETKAGVIPLTASGDLWTFQAGTPRMHPPTAARGELAAMLGLAESDVEPTAAWIDTGSEQLVVPLRSAEAVARCRPDPALLVRYASSTSNESRAGLAYVWARQPARQDEADGPPEIMARFFFLKHGSVVEDPGTGSACANLGGWLVCHSSALPVEFRIHQGEATGRPCLLALRVDRDRRIFVSGSVRDLGHGEVAL
jgi:PhzF family phenazine biosynthesis protein